MNHTSEIRTENKLNPMYMVVIGGTVTTAGLGLTVLSNTGHLLGGGCPPPTHVSSSTCYYCINSGSTDQGLPVDVDLSSCCSVASYARLKRIQKWVVKRRIGSTFNTM